ncbi:hypothetical protein [Bacillus sp. ISL-55]|uniref:hypothetical protein n=1 Tax=Bacillus sp. ISL-55 TaxID=2819134 RepID=UPI001BEBF505|nr:hypothetical protein [Bacillus sp. ISL-55]MBT2694787.1 hypothetical protein [Bacillus sp. ISL-55]
MWVNVLPQTVLKDSYTFNFILMIREWDEKTGKDKVEDYYQLIFTIINALGEDYREYEFFLPFMEWDTKGKHTGLFVDEPPEMTKEYYTASFNTVVYVIKKVLEESRVSEELLVLGLIAKIAKEFKLEISVRDKKIDGLKKAYESGRHPNQKGIGALLDKLQSEEYIKNLKYQLAVWEELVRKQKYINFL